MTSSSDRAILNSIFNPLLPVGEAVFDENLTEDLQDVENSNLPNEILSKVRELELNGIKLTENGEYQNALAVFNESVSLTPERASCYNNRAQLHRIMGNDVEALKDLSYAIEISGGHGRSACQAFTQRALVRKLRNETELAKQDYEIAANLGSKFARAELVQMNPYAALCNKMLAEVICKLNKGEQT